MTHPAHIAASAPATTWRQAALSLVRAIGNLRFVAANANDPAHYDARLDGLRGFAACSVMVVHGFGYDGPGPLTAANVYVRHMHLSRVSVLLFFVLSGYVIGLTNRRAYSPARAGEYVRRRLLRIFPIYLIALCFGALMDPGARWPNFVANLFFLQNSAWGVTALEGNLPVWSLHNEMVYYLGFILLWRWQPRVWPLGLALFLSTAGDWFLGGVFSVPGGWAAGAFFWLAGLLLAWNRLGSGSAPMVAFLLLGFATNHLWPGILLLNGLGFPTAGTASLWIADLVMLPVALVLFCALLGASFPGLKLIRALAILIPVATCLLLLKMGRLWENVPWTMSGIATVCALPLLGLEPPSWGQSLMRVFRPLGRISFGLYLLHVPIATLVTNYYPWRNGVMTNYLGGVLCWIAVSVACAWLCELKLQPSLNAIYRKRFPPVR